MENENREELLNDPTGGPSSGESSSPEERGSDTADLSAGAGGQEEGKGAVEEAAEQAGRGKQNPG